MYESNEFIWTIALWITCAFAYIWITVRKKIWDKVIYKHFYITISKPFLFAGLTTALICISFTTLDSHIYISNHIGAILLFFTPWLSCKWVNKANTSKNAWQRVAIAIGLTIILQITSLWCLHSKSLPRFLQGNELIKPEFDMQEGRE